MQLKEAMEQAGLVTPLISTDEKKVQQFYLTLTRFEIPIFIKVKAQTRQAALRFIGSRGLNSITEHEELTKEEAQQELSTKLNKWFLETPDDGMLVYHSFLK